MPYHRFWLLSFLLPLCLVAALAPKRTAQPTDMLIIAPHPDDAVLCCAGAIMRAKESGKIVRIVNVTDGDGYKAAAAVLFGKTESEVTPQDMRKFGRIRKKEELQALNLLGVAKHEVTFLGYPDGWLNEVYENETTTPVISPFTKKSGATSGGAYTKFALQNDITSLFRGNTPKEVYAPSGFDTALDHQAVYRAVIAGINTTNYPVSLHTYLVHGTRNQIPVPPESPFPLTRTQEEIKRQAIGRYRTQLLLDAAYLLSFAEHTEWFY